MIKRDTILAREVNAFAKKSLAELQALRSEKGLQKAGFPLGLIYNIDFQTEEIDYAYALPVSSTEGLTDVNLEAVPLLDDIPSIFVLELQSHRLHGHQFLNTHVSNQGLQVKFPVIEVYYKGPLGEEDGPQDDARLLYRTQ